MDPIELTIQSDTEEAQNSIQDLTDSINTLNDNIDDLNTQTKETSDSTDSFGDALDNVGTIIAAIGITDFISNVISLGESFVTTGLQSAEALENMGITMKYVFGGDQGGQILTFINQLTDASGLLSQTSLQNVAIQMSNLHLPTDKFKTDLSNLADVAAGAGGSADRMNQILDTTGRVLAIAGQSGSVPTLYFRRLELLIPGVTQALSQITGLPVDAFQSLSKNVKVSADQFEQLLDLLANTKYAGALQAQGDTIAGFFGRIQSSFSTTIDLILGETTSGGQPLKGSVLDKLQDLLQGVFNFLQSHAPEIKKFVDQIIDDFEKKLGPGIQKGFEWITTHPKEIEQDLQTFADIMKNLASFGAGFFETLNNIVNLIKGNDFQAFLRSIGTISNFLSPLNTSGSFKDDNGQTYSENKFNWGAFTGLDAKLGLASSSVNNSKTTHITMHNNISNQVDMSAAAREVGWRVSGR